MIDESIETVGQIIVDGLLSAGTLLLIVGLVLVVLYIVDVIKEHNQNKRLLRRKIPASLVAGESQGPGKTLIGFRGWAKKRKKSRKKWYTEQVYRTFDAAENASKQILLRYKENGVEGVWR